MKLKTFVFLDPNETKFQSGYDRARQIVTTYFGAEVGVQYQPQRGALLQFNDPDEFQTEFIVLVYPADTSGEARFELAGYIDRNTFMDLATAYNKQKLCLDHKDLRRFGLDKTLRRE